MPWRWTSLIDQKVRDTVAYELVGSTVRVEAAQGTPLAEATFTGKTETVVATASAKGKALKVTLTNRGGETLGAVPASEVCDRVDVEPGARVTVTLRLN